MAVILHSHSLSLGLIGATDQVLSHSLQQKAEKYSHLLIDSSPSIKSCEEDTRLSPVLKGEPRACKHA